MRRANPPAHMIAKPLSLAQLIGLLPLAVSFWCAADEQYEPLHYKCDGPRVIVWAQELWNEDGRNFRYFDNSQEGAYNPNALIRNGQAKKIRKRCNVDGLCVFDIVISPGEQCQGQVVPQLQIRWNGSMIFQAEDFGSNCSNVRAPYFIEADADTARLTVGYVDGPADSQGRPHRFTFGFPANSKAVAPKKASGRASP